MDGFVPFFRTGCVVPLVLRVVAYAEEKRNCDGFVISYLSLVICHLDWNGRLSTS